MSKPALTHENWRNEIKKENKELEDSAANKPTVKKLNPAFLDRFECNKISETGSEQPHRESWSPIQGKNVSETEKKQLHNESWLPVQGKKVGEIEKKQPHRKSWLPVQGNKVNKTEQKQPHKESWLPIQGKKVSETEKKKSHREFWLPVQENKVTEIRKTEPLQRQTQFLEVLSSFQHDSVGDNKTIHQPIEKPVSEPRRPLSSFQEGLHETLVVRDRQQESIPVVKPKRPPQPVFQVKSKEAGQAVCVTSKVNKMDQMPPQKPKRTYAHDIYKEAKTLQTHNKNKTDKLQKFAPNAGEPTRIKLPPPTLPPPPPPHSRGDTHPPSRKVSSASSHNYECISDWVIDDISTFSNKFKRSRSSEDLRTATELDHHVKEHIYAEPDVTQPKKTHRTYSDPYEISHDRQTALVNEDVCGYAVPERLEDMQRRYAHSLKIRGSAKMSSGESRRSNSLEDGNSLLYDEKKIKNKLPWIQRKINEAFMVLKRKKEKKIRSNGNVVDGISQDDSVNSDNENDVSDADHRRRLRHAQTVKETAVYCTLDKIRETMRYKKMFDYVVIVELAQNRETCKHEPFISYQFPQEISVPSANRLAAIPQFCFPDAANWAAVSAYTSETFSFVLTSIDGSRTFGYCRRLLPEGSGLRLPIVYCIVSPVGCFNLYSKLLDEVEERRMHQSDDSVHKFLQAVSARIMPKPGNSIEVKINTDTILLQRPMDSRLEHVDFGCLLSYLSAKRLIEIFASMILERRIIFTARKLSTLSGCIHAITALLYPFSWQHAYVPVLPIHLLEMCCLPTPYIIGILSVCVPELDNLELDEVLLVDLDGDCFIKAIGDEHTILPKKVQVALEKTLCTVYSSFQEHDDDCDNTVQDQMVSEAFMRYFVETVGHYKIYMKIFPNGSVHFQKEAFVKEVPSKSIRKFLEVFMESQMFSVLIHEKEMAKMKSIQGTFDKRVEEYAEVTAIMQPTGLAKLGNRVRAFGNKLVDAAKLKK